MAASVKQGFRQFRPKMQGASVGLVMRRGETLCQYLFDGFDADRAGQRDEGAKDGDVVRNGRAGLPPGGPDELDPYRTCTARRGGSAAGICHTPYR